MSLIDRITSSTQDKVDLVPTKWPSLNTALGGGLRAGGIVEIYGSSQIGKSAIGVQILPCQTVFHDLSRKLNGDYVRGIRTEGIIIDRKLNNDELFEFIESQLGEDVLFVIDDLPMVGSHLKDDIERFRWLYRKFDRLNRLIVRTRSIVLVLNQLRQIPSTGRMYNAHEGVLDPSVKIKVHHAENRTAGRLVYLEIEKCFWQSDPSRCTLLVKKNEITER